MNTDRVFKSNISVADLNRLSDSTMLANLGIEFTEIGADYIIAKMPVDERTIQPYGLLHGGASVALAETLGSVASHISIDQDNQWAVGLEVNANHLRPAKSGYVYGKVTPIHMGRKSHVWEIRITNEENKLICVSRLTVSIIDKP